MPYLGNTPTTQSFISGTDYFNGTGSQTAFTLSRSVASINDIQATVNNVVQQPNDAYTVSGTTITFTSAPSAGTNNIYVRYLSTTTQAITPSQGTVGLSAFSATGTPSSSTFLRGDNTWAAAGAIGNIFYLNGQTVTSSYTIADNTNAMSAGPITVDTGVTVTIGNNSNWVIV